MLGYAQTSTIYGTLVEPERLVYPRDSSEEARLFEDIVRHHQRGGYVAIVDGAFDVPHEGHVWYLRGCRTEAAAMFFGQDFNLLNNTDTQAQIADERIMLIVTLDADCKVAAKKGRVAEKGGIARPVYPWVARANRIGGYMIPDGVGSYRPVVDLITVEGDAMHHGSPLESHVHFGSRLYELGVLDAWLIYEEHQEAAETALHIAGADAVTILPTSVMRAIDERSGNKWSSTNIIKTIKGEV